MRLSGCLKLGPTLQPPMVIKLMAQAAERDSRNAEEPERPEGTREKSGLDRDMRLSLVISGRSGSSAFLFGTSLIPQRLDGVHAGGLPGGVEAEDDADKGGDGDGGDDGFERGLDRPFHERLDRLAAAAPEGEADEAAGEAEECGLGEELAEDVLS